MVKEHEEGDGDDGKFHFRHTELEVYVTEPAKSIEEAGGK